MFDMQNEQENSLLANVDKLKVINREIEKLSLQKEELTKNVIQLLNHKHDGQKTYDLGALKLEVKTPYIYSLDKKKYESAKSMLPAKFNPVKESVAYFVDKRLCDRYIQEAPQEVLDILIELIDKKPGKAAITIKEFL
jgi:hypothetical protein